MRHASTDLAAYSIEYRQHVTHVTNGERGVEKLPLLFVTFSWKMLSSLIDRQIVPVDLV